MSKENILTKGAQSRVIKFIDTIDSFDLDDYKLLVKNNLSNCDFCILLIKYKFNLLPSKELLQICTTRWKKEIIAACKLTIDDLYELINSKVMTFDDYDLAQIIDKTDGIFSMELFKYLVINKFEESIKILLKRYDDFMPSDIIDLMITHQQIDSNTYIKCETIEDLIKFVNRRNYLYDDDLKKNIHLFKEDNDYTLFFSKLLIPSKHIYLTHRILLKFKKPSKELIKNVPIETEKIFKYYDMYPDLYPTIKLADVIGLLFTNIIENDFKLITKKIMENNYSLSVARDIVVATIIGYLLKNIYSGNEEKVRKYIGEFKLLKPPKLAASHYTIYETIETHLASIDKKNKPKVTKTKKIAKAVAIVKAIT